MTRFHLEVTFDLEVVGTEADVERLRDEIDELVYDSIPWYCGEPECCPVKPEGIHGTFGSSSSQINPISKEGDE